MTQTATMVVMLRELSSSLREMGLTVGSPLLAVKVAVIDRSLATGDYAWEEFRILIEEGMAYLKDASGKQSKSAELAILRMSWAVFLNQLEEVS